MSLISRITTWVAGQTLKAADLNGEFNNITNLLNNLDSDSTRWTTVDAATFKRTGTTVIPILQIVTATTTSTTSATSSSFTITNLTASITPVATTSKILVLASGVFGANTQNKIVYATLFRGNTDLGVSTNGLAEVIIPTSGATFSIPVSMFAYDSPSTTSSTTYSARIKNGDNSTTINFGDSGITQYMVLVELGF